MSAPEPTAEHWDEANRIAPLDCPVSAITRIAHALAAEYARGFERGRDRAADLAESKYAAWLADPEIRGGTERALTEYANMARDIRAIKEPQ